MNMRRLFISWLLCSFFFACGSDEAAVDPGGSTLSPGGAQDFGRFKAVLDSGELPGPETLDQVGFFAEHKIGTPPTSCAGPVCAEARHGAMANMVSGSLCTLVHLALGTPIDPMTQPRPSVDVAVVIDESTPALLDRYSDLTIGLNGMLDALQANDTISLIGSGRDLRLIATRVPAANRDSVRPLLGMLHGQESGGLYDGLRLAADTLGAPQTGRHRRIVLLTSTSKNVGIRADRIARLVRGFAEKSGGVTVISLGEVGDPRLLQQLTDVGAGALYYAASPQELQTMFSREVSYSMVPIAEKVKVSIEAGSSWRLREVFGLGRNNWSLRAATGEIYIPSLLAAWRQSGYSGDDRRGGGGAILIEVLPRPDAPRERPSKVADVRIEYSLPGGGATMSQSLQVSAPDGPWDTPEAGRFETTSVEKGFVVLNLYVALRMASERSAQGDLRGALDVLRSIDNRAGAWAASHFEPEIDNDLIYVRKFIANLESRGVTNELPRADWFNDPWPRD
jgi:Ca-activated chloride channel family protein